jgi:pimeloyl-ACP methyl ester carboxylesterase
MAPRNAFDAVGAIHSRFVVAGGLRTHFLEAGEGVPVVLLHSGEFGGCAELSWERTIPALAPHFRVIAPDWSGCGETEKVFSFDDMWGYRLRHIAAFLQVLNIERAHFIGNSMGGTLLLKALAERHDWPVERAIIISGGGSIPDNAARETLNSYDGTVDHMRRIVGTIFVDPAFANDKAHVERRHALSRKPGAWEATAAARLRAPWRTAGQRMPQPPDYAAIKVPVLLITGARDPLREVGFGARLQQQIPGSDLYEVPDCGHCPHIERPAEVNAAMLHFLRS